MSENGILTIILAVLLAGLVFYATWRRRSITTDVNALGMKFKFEASDGPPTSATPVVAAEAKEASTPGLQKPPASLDPPSGASRVEEDSSIHDLEVLRNATIKEGSTSNVRIGHDSHG